MKHDVTPGWVIEESKVPQVGSVLFTKDGRMTGNAIIDYVHDFITNDGVVNTLYNCISDAGNVFYLTEKQLKKQFYQPKYVSDVKTHPGYVALMNKWKIKEDKNA